jgi:hypothetical protein
MRFPLERRKQLQSPITDKDIGISHSPWGLGDDKFRLVRQKAQEERQELKHRSKKDKTVKVPEYKPGERVVVASDRFSKGREYRLFEVVDFYQGGRWGWSERFGYFGILLKTTSKNDLLRIGRLFEFSGDRFDRTPPAHVDENSVKWLENA